MSWFTKLFGILEQNGTSIQRSFELSADHLFITAPNGTVLRCGRFYTPSVRELREEIAVLLKQRRPLQEVQSKCTYDHTTVQDAIILHSQFPNSVIQAASQFNCLEFPNPNTVPEDGIEAYESDRTQGPSCALACAAGTIYRNYFAPVGDRVGQSSQHQINNLDNFEQALDNQENEYFYVRNGYVFSKSRQHLSLLSERLKTMNPTELDELRQIIKVGVQEDTEVSYSCRMERLEDNGITVTQVYCSAISCGYSGFSNEYWEPMAKLVLEAAYEATILVAIKSALKHEMLDHHSSTESDSYRDVFLTAVGGGVFLNDLSWIGNAIGRAIALATSFDVYLRIHVCHFRSIKPDLQDSVDSFTEIYLYQQNQ